MTNKQKKTMKSAKPKQSSSQAVTEPQQYVPIPGEAWRPIPRYSGFEASTLGRIRNTETGHILAVTGGPEYEYPRVSLTHNGKMKTIECHRLVAAAFIGPTPPGHHINHKNADKYFCALENLEIITIQRNRDHAIQHGHCGGKLKPSDVQAVRRLLASNVPIATIAEAFAVKPAAITNIARGRAWKAIPELRDLSDEQQSQPSSFAI